MEEGQTVSHHIVFVLYRYTLEQTNCFNLLGITGAQRSRDFPTHLSLSDLHLLPIEYDRWLARSRIDLVEAITRYTNKPINYPFRMRPAYFTSPLQGTTWGPSATPSGRHKTSLVHRSSLSCIAVNAPRRTRSSLEIEGDHLACVVEPTTVAGAIRWSKSNR